MESEIKIDADSAEESHYLVAVSGSGNSEYLIRWTSAAAKRQNSGWTALHIKVPGSETDSPAIERNLELARRLGAEVLSVRDQDIASAIIQYARMKRATVLVVGKTMEGGTALLGKRTVMERILRESGDIDILLLRGKNPVQMRVRDPILPRLKGIFRGFPIALLSISSLTLVGLMGQPAIGYRSISILYLLAIIALPFACSRASVLAGAVLSALIWNFLFIPPRMTFSIGSLEDILMFAAFFLSAFVGGLLTSRLKEKEASLSLREGRMALFYGFARALSKTHGIEELAAIGRDYLMEHMGIGMRLFLRNRRGALEPCGAEGEMADEGFALPPDIETARKCLEENASIEDSAGRLYIPLGAPDAIIGVMAVSGNGRVSLRGEGREVLATLAGNISLALERELLAGTNEEHKMAAESERLARILLDHVSHELRTPLTTIKGSVSGLLERGVSDDPEFRGELLRETLKAADALDALVEDLLSMSRLKTGHLRLNLERTSVAELLGAAQESLKSELADHTVEMEESFREIELDIDPALMVQVFRNILRNFRVHTPPGSCLIVTGAEREGVTELRFADDGPGIPENELSSLFTAFFRGSNATKTKGSGLGLAICRGIVEAHGGIMEASRSETGGLAIAIRLPERGAR